KLTLCRDTLRSGARELFQRIEGRLLLAAQRASTLTGMDPPVLTFADPGSARMRAVAEGHPRSPQEGPAHCGATASSQDDAMRGRNLWAPVDDPGSELA